MVRKNTMFISWIRLLLAVLFTAGFAAASTTPPGFEPIAGKVLNLGYSNAKVVPTGRLI